MSVENFLQFLFKHNTGLIEGLVALVLLFILFLAFRNFNKATSDELGTGGGNLSELEATLKKLLEKASLVPNGSAGMGATSPELINEIDTLKRNLEERQAEIEKLKSKTQVSGEAPGLTDKEKGKLESQIQELQGKLTEYEIISEDIADLSFYKEENAKLKKQAEMSKEKSPANQEVAPIAKPAEPAKAVEAVAPAPAAEIKPLNEPEIIGKSKTEEPIAKASAVAENPVPSGIDQDLMDEFEKTVEEQKAAPDLGSMDMDKMLMEADGINQSTGGEEEINSLEKGLDEDKLLKEAAALTDVKPEDKNLMNEFENFVKKGS